MRGLMRVIAVTIAAGAGATLATAGTVGTAGTVTDGEPDPTPVKPGEPGAEPKLVAPTAKRPDAPVGWTHKGQLEVSARVALGLRAIVTYDDKNYCGKSDATARNGNSSVCTSRAPFGLDLELG